MKPCCEEFSKRMIAFCDLSAEADDKLLLIIHLLASFSNEAPLEMKQVHTLGFMLEEYLNTKIVVENYFFNRSMSSCTFEDSFLKQLLDNLKAKSNS